MRDPSVETRLLEPARRLHDGYPDSPFAPHRLAALRRSFGLFIPYSLFPVPYSLFPIPYSLFPVPCSLFPVPCSLFPVPYLRCF